MRRGCIEKKKEDGINIRKIDKLVEVDPTATPHKLLYVPSLTP